MKPLVTVIVAISCAFSSVYTAAQSSWFTVVGNSSAAHENTVQVNVASIKGTAELRTAQIRVSRSNTRHSPWAKVDFRSFVALTEFDCKARSARYLQTDFHSLPLWQGQPFHSVTYSPEVVAVMRFRDISPNPAERIVRAACELNSVSTSWEARALPINT